MQPEHETLQTTPGAEAQRRGARTPPPLDLSAAPSLQTTANRLLRHPFASSDLRLIESLTGEQNPRDRQRRLSDVARKLDAVDTTHLLKLAAKMALQRKPGGIRLLFGFLEVRRPGAEVLRQLKSLSSLERISLRLIHGTWQEAENAQETHPAIPIVEILEEATKVGALDLEIPTLPRETGAVRALYDHLRAWFSRIAWILQNGQRVPDDVLYFLTQIAMLEIHLMEQRVSNLASAIDPYDVRAMARLMPILSRYDQDIEHMKNVASRLKTYEPFFERMLTMEHVLSNNEMDKLLKQMNRDPAAAGLGRLLSAMRTQPILDREYAYHVSQIHQLSTLRTKAVGAKETPDILSMMLDTVEHLRPDGTLEALGEPEVFDDQWNTIRTWGPERLAADRLRLFYREDYTLEFIDPDGTPRLPENPEEKPVQELGMLELIRLQMNNEPFIMGILDNPKATSKPGIVTTIAASTRSLRVLDKIMRVRALYTGASNKDVPRILLTSPARIPTRRLTRFIHVRFVNKTDLARLAGKNSDVRQEIRREIEVYLRSLRS